MNDFEKGLTDWYAKPTADHTYDNFKSHFETAYSSLRKVRGVTMRNSIFQQQANSVTERVLQEIKLDNQNVRDGLKATEIKLFNVFQNMVEYQAKETDNENTPVQPSVNLATSNDNVQLEILKALKDLKADLRKGKQTQPQKRESEQNDRKNGKKKLRRRYDTSKYCHTCGGNHYSKDCRRKAPGHKDEATFKNMIGGCTDYCQSCE